MVMVAAMVVQLTVKMVGVVQLAVEMVERAVVVV